MAPLRFLGRALLVGLVAFGGYIVAAPLRPSDGAGETSAVTTPADPAPPADADAQAPPRTRR